jgi:hypothetical protein
MARRRTSPRRSGGSYGAANTYRHRRVQR